MQERPAASQPLRSLGLLFASLSPPLCAALWFNIALCPASIHIAYHLALCAC